MRYIGLMSVSPRRKGTINNNGFHSDLDKFVPSSLVCDKHNSSKKNSVKCSV